MLKSLVLYKLLIISNPTAFFCLKCSYSNINMGPIESAASCQTASITLRDGSLLTPFFATPHKQTSFHLAPVSLTVFFAFVWKCLDLIPSNEHSALSCCVRTQGNGALLWDWPEYRVCCKAVWHGPVVLTLWFHIGPFGLSCPNCYRCSTSTAGARAIKKSNTGTTL